MRPIDRLLNQAYQAGGLQAMRAAVDNAVNKPGRNPATIQQAHRLRGTV
jgi:hypothetical protein